MNYQEIDEKVSVLKSILIKSLVVIGVALLVGAGYMAYQSHLESQNAKAAELFYNAHEMEIASKAKPTTPEEASQLQAFDAATVLTWDAPKLEAYLKILKQLDDDYSGTPTWALSQIRRAKISVAQKNYAEAEKLYDSVISKMNKTPLFVGLASDSLAVMFEEQGQHDKALEVFKKASSNSKNPLRPLALLGEARTLQTLGKPGAAEVFDKVVKEYPESAYSRRAKVLKAGVR